MKIILILTISCSFHVGSALFLPVDFMEEKLSEVVSRFGSIINSVKYSITGITHYIKSSFKSKCDGTTSSAPAFGTHTHSRYNQDSFFGNYTSIPSNSTKKPTFILGSYSPDFKYVLPSVHGLRIESHVVLTEDGYLLTVHRILPRNTTLAKNQTVLLHHGLFGSSFDWLILDENSSLPIILSKDGYDVWMANARGNHFSKRHMFYKQKSTAYWNFTFHEIGKFDLPAVIDYIRNAQKNNNSINYIGHSMGATALLVLLSSVPRYNEYLRMGVLLAPLAYMSYTRGPLSYLAALNRNLAAKFIETITVHGQVFPKGDVPSWLAEDYCSGPRELCRNPLLFLCGGVQKMKRRRTAFVRRFLKISTGMSAKTLMHFIEIIHSKKFHKYDYPSDEYVMKNVTLPMALYSSDGDWLASVPGVVKLYQQIVHPVHHTIIRSKRFGHGDFVWGSEADALIYREVKDLLLKGPTLNPTISNEV